MNTPVHPALVEILTYAIFCILDAEKVKSMPSNEFLFHLEKINRRFASLTASSSGIILPKTNEALQLTLPKSPTELADWLHELTPPYPTTMFCVWADISILEPNGINYAWARAVHLHLSDNIRRLEQFKKRMTKSIFETFLTGSDTTDPKPNNTEVTLMISVIDAYVESIAKEKNYRFNQFLTNVVDKLSSCSEAKIGARYALEELIKTGGIANLSLKELYSICFDMNGGNINVSIIRDEDETTNT